MSRFNREYDSARKEIERAIEKTVRAASIEMFGEIVKRTPVGNPVLWKSDPPAGYIGGRLRANWQADINRVPTETINNVQGDNRINTATVSSYKTKDTIFLANNLPYAERVENGWSTQRPQGMMKVTTKAWGQYIDKAARRNKV